jgi:pimeloyl-ACP methyl ester carboxylesterase
MNSQIIKRLGALSSLAIFVAAMNASTSFAQDAENTRYSPEGRNIARTIGGLFDERLYEVRTYDPEPSVAEFAAATIFYPLTLSFDAPIGAVALIPGYGATQEQYNWWGPMLASLGIAVMIIDTNDPTDGLDARRSAQIAAVNFLKNENTESDSPLLGKIDPNKIAIMGHSIGAGGSLYAADELGNEIKAVVALSPYCCELGQPYERDFSSLEVPTLIVVSAEDPTTAPEDHARAIFDSIAPSTHRIYTEFTTGDHNISRNGGPELDTLGKYAYAWIKAHFGGGAPYMAIFNNVVADDAAKFSRFDVEL